MREIKKLIVLENKLISSNIYSMVLQSKGLAKISKPGQFINLYCREGSRLLPRPISICEINKLEDTIKLVYAVVGAGTKEFSNIKVGEKIEALGPLGNGFIIEKDKTKNIIVGGGIGVPPLLELAKNLNGEIEVYLGFRSKSILIEDFKKYGAKVHVATEDGSEGFKGNVLELMKKNNVNGSIIYSCGPKPMLKAVAKWAKKKNIPMQVSLEERMACGIGVCVGCVCKIKDKNQSDWQYKKVCKDGPVFWSDEVIWDE
ncbi:dihydroorotate dehydrogenase electron transfer subunit [Defluviitalea phaphyphila]|uniref:dihydroorotate dehydrogenase electron transfer subunit n=1 Tax=Defluviitalea phaphyphila TaxID=1473580 RepID=UPI00072FF786|nr:dihydroorotate dehydrogenase electron transfer subunit [Defluviitalea phaphyphila]